MEYTNAMWAAVAVAIAAVAYLGIQFARANAERRKLMVQEIINWIRHETWAWFLTMRARAAKITQEEFNLFMQRAWRELEGQYGVKVPMSRELFTKIAWAFLQAAIAWSARLDEEVDILLAMATSQVKGKVPDALQERWARIQAMRGT